MFVGFVDLIALMLTMANLQEKRDGLGASFVFLEHMLFMHKCYMPLTTRIVVLQRHLEQSLM